MQFCGMHVHVITATFACRIPQWYTYIFKFTVSFQQCCWTKTTNLNMYMSIMLDDVIYMHIRSYRACMYRVNLNRVNLCDTYTCTYTCNLCDTYTCTFEPSQFMWYIYVSHIYVSHKLNLNRVNLCDTYQMIHIHVNLMIHIHVNLICIT